MPDVGYCGLLDPGCSGGGKDQLQPPIVEQMPPGQPLPPIGRLPEILVQPPPGTTYIDPSTLGVAATWTIRIGKTDVPVTLAEWLQHEMLMATHGTHHGGVLEPPRSIFPPEPAPPFVGPPAPTPPPPAAPAEVSLDVVAPDISRATDLSPQLNLPGFEVQQAIPTLEEVATGAGVGTWLSRALAFFTGGASGAALLMTPTEAGYPAPLEAGLVESFLGLPSSYPTPSIPAPQPIPESVLLQGLGEPQPLVSVTAPRPAPQPVPIVDVMTGTMPSLQTPVLPAPQTRVRPAPAPLLGEPTFLITRPGKPPLRGPSPKTPPRPVTAPAPFGAPHTPVPPIKTDQCQCPPPKQKDKQKKKKQPRTKCYKGTYYERAKGLTKYRKVEIPCR